MLTVTSFSIENFTTKLITEENIETHDVIAKWQYHKVGRSHFVNDIRERMSSKHVEITLTCNEIKMRMSQTQSSTYTGSMVWYSVKYPHFNCVAYKTESFI